MRLKRRIKKLPEEEKMKNNETNEKKPVSLGVKIMAGVLALLMLSGTVFGLIAYLM